MRCRCVLARLHLVGVLPSAFRPCRPHFFVAPHPTTPNNKKRSPFGNLLLLLERAMGFGPTTSTLARLRSTPELYPHHLRTGYLITHKKIKCKNFFHIFVKKFQIIFKMFIKQDFTRLFEFNFL